MDLISRKALLAAYDERHKGPPGGARELIEDATSVPAVPLGKLCEWLGMHVVPPVSDCLLTTEARTAAWKVVLNKFVEEQDAAD